MVKPVAGYRPLAYSSPEPVQTTGTVAGLAAERQVMAATVAPFRGRGEMPRPKVAMRRIKEVLRLKEGLGLSDTAVSRSVRIARSTVKEYLDRAAAAGLNWETVAELSEEELDRRLFAAVDTRHWDRPLPDWEAVEKELRGRGVTLRLLLAGISEPASGGLPLHPVLRAFPCLAATRPAADDAPAASRRRGARSRLRWHDAECHRQGCRPPGAGFRCLLALLGPDLRRSELDPRSRGLARCPCPRLRLYRRLPEEGDPRQPQDRGDRRQLLGPGAEPQLSRARPPLQRSDCPGTGQKATGQSDGFILHLIR